MQPSAWEKRRLFSPGAIAVCITAIVMAIGGYLLWTAVRPEER
jgi:hypothetical protein